MTHTVKILVAVTLCTVAALALLGGPVVAKAPQTLTPVADRPLAPPFDLKGPEGEAIRLEDFRGKPLIVNFWATWCPPCREEIPEFIDMQKQYADNNLQIVGIAIEDRNSVNEFAKTMPFNYPILIAEDGGMSLSQQLGNVVGAVPFTVVADANGQIVYRRPGQMTKERLLEVIEPLFSSH